MFKYKKKLKSKSGNAMILAIFLLTIVSMFTMFILKLTSNQIKSTMNNQEWMQSKYLSEAGAEQIIANAIETIRVRKNVDNTLELTFDNTLELTDKIKGEMQLKEGKTNQLLLNIESESLSYKLKAEVSIGVNITSETDYDISYSVDKWEKE